jgi:glycosyltransferase involved in cell wall biosynthesis
MFPKISIIVPVFNTDKYLKRCLDSIVNQTFEEIEILCINDGSTDNSLKILEEYKKKDERITLIKQTNQGLSATRNKGIKLASAKYLFFVDSDDTIESNVCEILYNRISKNDKDIYFFKLNFFNSKDELISMSEDLPDNKEELFKLLISLKITVSASSCIYKKELFVDNNIEYPINKYFEDNATTYKLCYFAKSIEVVNKAFYNYFIENENSITNSFNIKHMEDVIYSIIETKSFLLKKNIFFNYQKQYQERIDKCIFFTFKFINNNYLNIDKIEILKILWNFIVDNKNFMQYSRILYWLELSMKMLNYELEDSLVKTISLGIFDFERVFNTLHNHKELGLISLLLDCFNNLKKSKVYIYGIGEVYQKMKPFLISNNIEVFGFFDKKAENNELIFDNIKVFSPKTTIPSLSDKDIIVVLSVSFAEEITNYIKNLNSRVKVLNYYTEYDANNGCR